MAMTVYVIEQFTEQISRPHVSKRQESVSKCRKPGYTVSAVRYHVQNAQQQMAANQSSNRGGRYCGSRPLQVGVCRPLYETSLISVLIMLARLRLRVMVLPLGSLEYYHAWIHAPPPKSLLDYSNKHRFSGKASN